MKFERMFLWSMNHGARLLFGLAILFVIASIVSAIFTLADYAGVELAEPISNVSTFTSTGNLLLAMLAPFAIPAKLLFGALIVNHLDRWASARRESTDA